MMLGWADIVKLIISEGIPAAYKLWQLVTAGKDPTEEDWQALLALEAQTAADQMKAAIVRAGIPLDSPQAVALLALLK